MSPSRPLGELVLETARQAGSRLDLCAPFVKAAPLAQVLEVARPEVAVRLFTRWRPDEVAAGVSDTAVLEMLAERGGSVHLCDRLHAKLFRSDDRALVGSANLTGAALGWSANPNLEVLLEVPPDHPAIAALEAELSRSSILATPQIAAEIDRVAAMLPRAPQPPAAAEPARDGSVPWHPLLREPRDLFVAYSGQLERLSHTSRGAAAGDLAALEPPLGLGREAFESLVASRLSLSPLVRQVDAFLVESRRFGEVRALLAESLKVDRQEADHAWQTLMRWLLYFLPRRYSRSVPSHSEILVRMGDD